MRQMPESHLPENCAEWPKDAFAILNVPGTADERTIKRAYHQLIRLYKPEHFPEQFRRIREAFDSATGIAQWRARFNDDDEEDDDEPAGEDSSSGPRPESPDESSTSPSQDDEAADSVSVPQHRRRTDPWDLVVSGDPRAAWTELETRYRQSPDEEQTAIQRYWLARLHPEISSQTHPIEFLVRCLHTGRTGDRILRAYFQAAAGYEPELCGPRLWELLCRSRNPQRWEEIVCLRWAMFLHSGRGEMTRSDLELLEPHVTDDVECWLSFLNLALGIACRNRGTSAITVRRYCERQLKQHAEFGIRYPAAFDEAEVHLALAEKLDYWKLHAREDVAARITELAAGIRRMMDAPASYRNGILRPIVEAWVVHPTGALKDIHVLSTKVPPLAHELINAVNGFWYSTGAYANLLDGASLEEALRRETELCKSFRSPLMSFEVFEERLLQFCLTQVTDLPNVLEAFRKITEVKTSEPYERLLQNRPLQCVIRGVQACWC